MKGGRDVTKRDDASCVAAPVPPARERRGNQNKQVLLGPLLVRCSKQSGRGKERVIVEPT